MAGKTDKAEYLRRGAAEGVAPTKGGGLGGLGSTALMYMGGPLGIGLMGLSALTQIPGALREGSDLSDQWFGTDILNRRRRMLEQIQMLMPSTLSNEFGEAGDLAGARYLNDAGRGFQALGRVGEGMERFGGVRDALMAERLGPVLAAQSGRLAAIQQTMSESPGAVFDRLGI